MSKPILFTIIGAITGLIISQIEVHTSIQYIEIPFFVIALLVASFTLSWQKVSNPVLIKCLVFLGLILAGITFYHFWQDYQKIRKAEPFFIIALIQITVICTAFFQSWRSEKPRYKYTDLFENAWNNHFYYIFSGLLTGAFLLILALGTNLFDTIGLKVSRIIWSQEVTPAIVGALLGAGVGISREYDQLIFKFRSIFFALFRILAYLTAAIVIIFSFVLPFYIDTLFADKNTSVILLSIVAVSIALLNALEDKDSVKLPHWANKIFTLQIILLPILTSVSIYAISLRIDQYGLTPSRIIALWASLLIGLHAFGYLFELIRNTILSKGSWSLGFASVNPPLAIVWVISLILLASPLLDPMKLSVNNQLSRLKNDKVAIDDFDFYSFKYRLGNPGKEAIKEILSWKDHPKFSLIKEKIEKAKRYSGFNNQKIRKENIKIIGDDPQKIEELKKAVTVWRCKKELPCFIRQIPIARDGSNRTMFIFFMKQRENKYLMKSDLYQFEKFWKKTRRYSSKPFAQERLSEVIKSIQKEEVKTLQPKYMDFEINGIELRSGIR